LLALIELEPDLTLDEVVSVMRELKISGSRMAIWRFFQRHEITPPTGSTRCCVAGPRTSVTELV
jgi:hypothetical protein